MGCCCQKAVEQAPAAEMKPHSGDYSAIETNETPKSGTSTNGRTANIDDIDTSIEDPTFTSNGHNGRATLVLTPAEHEEAVYLKTEVYSTEDDVVSDEECVTENDPISEENEVIEDYVATEDDVITDIIDVHPDDNNDHHHHLDDDEEDIDDGATIEMGLRNNQNQNNNNDDIAMDEMEELENEQNENRDEMDDGDFGLKPRSSHWRQQTMEILVQIDEDVVLGSDFEDEYVLEHFYSHSYSQHSSTPKSESPLKINPKPHRKSTQNNNDIPIHDHDQIVDDSNTDGGIESIENIEEDTPFSLQIGSTMSSNTKSCDASIFNVRGMGYAAGKKSKDPKLVPSGDALYDVIGADCFQIDDQSAMKMNIRSMLKQYDLGMAFDTEHINNESLENAVYPNLIVVSMLIPLFTKKERNGLHLIVFAKASKELSTFDEVTMSHFKLSAKIPNLKQTTLPKITKKLVKTLTGKCMSFDPKNATFEYLDVNRNVFHFCFNGYGLKKSQIKGLSTMRDHLDAMEFQFGFHIGGKTKDVLPERMLLCAKIRGVSVSEFDHFQQHLETKKTEHENEKLRKIESRSRLKALAIDTATSFD